VVSSGGTVVSVSEGWPTDCLLSNIIL
jgi:hypothetical protein